MEDNHCVICWAVIPEGRLVCPTCERRILQDQPIDNPEPRAKKRGLFARIKNHFKKRKEKNHGHYED